MGRSSPYVSLEEERRRAAPPERTIPLCLLTGFLGAGKTTLLNRLLSAPQGKRIAVLVNDVGQINVDRQLLSERAGDLIELSGGCVCCQIDLQRDLWSGVDDLIERTSPDVVVLETTGIADPRVLLEAWEKVPERTRAVVPSGVVCVVDAELGLRGAARPEWSAQLEAADRIVLTKLDRADAASLPALHARLLELAPKAERAAFPSSEEGTRALAQFLLEERKVRSARGGEAAHRHSQLNVCSFADDGALLEAPLRALVEGLGEALVRMKGHAWLVGDAGRRYAYVERAGLRTSVEDREAGRGARTELVLIVDASAAGALDEEALRRQLWACRVA
jgi:G3E family GTPase